MKFRTRALFRLPLRSRRTALISLGILAAIGVLLPASPVHAEAPSEIGIPFAIETSGKLLSLERQRVNEAAHVKAFGFGGMNTTLTFAGKSSPVQIKAGATLRFVIRFASMPPTPSSIVSLDALTAKKNNRELVTGKVRAMGLSGSSTNGESEIQLKFIPGENSVLSFQPLTPLPPGEYLIRLKDTPHGFLFTVIP